MQRNRLLVVAMVLVLFVVIGGFLALRGLGVGGRNVSVTLTVSGDKMQPDNPTVTQNDNVTITVTADRKEEVHLHGYDVHFEIPGPGQSVTHTFKADKSGSFDMEIEETSTPLGSFTVKPS